MDKKETTQVCLNCNTTENDIPLIKLTYSKQPAYICSHCLPLLIHHPEELIGKLKGAENIPPAAPDE